MNNMFSKFKNLYLIYYTYIMHIIQAIIMTYVVENLQLPSTVKVADEEMSPNVKLYSAASSRLQSTITRMYVKSSLVILKCASDVAMGWPFFCQMTFCTLDLFNSHSNVALLCSTVD